jgi:hypothetical protein
MDRVPKRQNDADGESVPDEDFQAQSAGEVLRRQAAAACLRAARLTDDATERESLRRQAAELLSGRRRRP